MRVYSVRMNKVAVTGAITLVQLKAGSSSICRILRAWCSQFNQTSSVMQDILILRKSAAATVDRLHACVSRSGRRRGECCRGNLCDWHERIGRRDGRRHPGSG